MTAVFQLGITGPQGSFSEKGTPDLDGFTKKPVVLCDVRVVKNTSVDDSKQMMQMINR